MAGLPDIRHLYAGYLVLKKKVNSIPNMVSGFMRSCVRFRCCMGLTAGCTFCIGMIWKIRIQSTEKWD